MKDRVTLKTGVIPDKNSALHHQKNYNKLKYKKVKQNYIVRFHDIKFFPIFVSKLIQSLWAQETYNQPQTFER